MRYGYIFHVFHVLHLTSYILHLTSYILHLTSSTSFSSKIFILHTNRRPAKSKRVNKKKKTSANTAEVAEAVWCRFLIFIKVPKQYWITACINRNKGEVCAGCEIKRNFEFNFNFTIIHWRPCSSAVTETSKVWNKKKKEAKKANRI